MNRIFFALVISTALTAPAFAEAMAADVACSDFLAMGQDDQMGAMTDAMSSDTMAADGAMATDTTTQTGDAMAAAPAVSADDEMAALVEACTAHPDMMAMDAIHMMN